jgi:hypothetical protein
VTGLLAADVPIMEEIRDNTHCLTFSKHQPATQAMQSLHETCKLIYTHARAAPCVRAHTHTDTVYCTCTLRLVNFKERGIQDVLGSLDCVDNMPGAVHPESAFSFDRAHQLARDC